MSKDIAILIPAYKPDENLLKLIDALLALELNNIIVVRDGGGSEYDKIFQQVIEKGCILCAHPINLGKGMALKTGFQYFLDHFPQGVGVITADADGQHAPQDILKVVQELYLKSSNLILGVREFDKSIPLRSRFGNLLTRKLFYFLVGKKVSDTQTGLRGIPKIYLQKFIELRGEQYEYEINMLASTKKFNIDISEVPIATIYIDNNRSSHFNPILDSIKIYAILLRFSLSGLISFVIDYALFAIIFAISGKLAFASYSSRFCSMFINFSLNKNYVFMFSGNKIIAFIKYFIACLVSISISYFAILLISKYSNFSVYLSKIIIDTILFFVNFYIQNKYVFKKR